MAELPLGKRSQYEEVYNPTLLCPINRADNRKELGLEADDLPFHGVDIWNAYEVSWLNGKGRPEVGMLELHVPCTTPCIIESKSLKLYLGSFNQTRFNSRHEVIQTIESDLSVATRGAVMLHLHPLDDAYARSLSQLEGKLLDRMDVEIDEYQYNPHLLQWGGHAELSETLISHLFRSLCPVTHQPDWASIMIRYRGTEIDHESVLRYLVSYRRHADFHEHCVERIYSDLMEHCQPKQLTVYARFTRRGGIDINPYRSNFESNPHNLHLFRQ